MSGYNLSAGDTVDAADLEQVYRASGPYAADAQANDSYAITVVPAPASVEAGMVFHFKANTLNTGAATLDVNGLGAIAIVKNQNAPLVTGDIIAGEMVSVIFDGTNFQMISGGGTRSAVSSPVTHSSTSTENVDTAVTTSFRPKIITVFYDLQGKEGSGTATYARGVATFDGTTLISNLWFWKNKTSTSFELNVGVCDNVAPVAGTGGTNGAVSLSITSVANNGYTIRAAFVAGSTFTGTKANFYSIANA